MNRYLTVLNDFLPWLFKNIKIKYVDFRADVLSGSLKTVFENNAHLVFYGHIYTKADAECVKYFKTNLKKYFKLFDQIFEDDTHLVKFLHAVYKDPYNADDHIFIQLAQKYQYLSPNYIANIYYTQIIAVEENSKDATEALLNKQYSICKSYMEEFKKKFIELVRNFFKLDYHSDNSRKFIIDVHILINRYIGLLLEIEIYCPKLLISKITDKILPLKEWNDSDDFQLIIV